MKGIPLLVAASLSLFGTTVTLAADEGEEPEYIEGFVRWGAGGFRDGRSPVGALGGDQLSLSIKPANQPFGLALMAEYYTNGPEPTHSYEIDGLYSLNPFYTNHFAFNPKLHYFASMGSGQLKVPKGDPDRETRYSARHYNAELLLDYRAFERFGFYAAGKYLYAQKKVNGERVVDFKEWIGLLGISYRFSI